MSIEKDGFLSKGAGGNIKHEIVDKDQLFIDYANNNGFLVACRDLGVDRSEWQRLQNLMRKERVW